MMCMLPLGQRAVHVWAQVINIAYETDKRPDPGGFSSFIHGYPQREAEKCFLDFCVSLSSTLPEDTQFVKLYEGAERRFFLMVRKSSDNENCNINFV